MDLNKSLIKITSAFKQNHIPYMIIGGQAVLLYGEPRLTKDIDITIGVGIDKFELIQNIIKNLRMISLVNDPEKFVKKNYVLPLKDKGSEIRIDIIFSFTEYELQAIKRAKNVAVNKVNVKFAAVEDIIIHKIFAGRPRDIDDIKSILLKNKNIDKLYINKWLKVLIDEDKKDLTDVFNKLF